MECEMCGKDVQTRRHLVEGNAMDLGMCCARYGTPLDRPAPKGTPGATQQNVARGQSRGQARNVYDQEALDLVEDYGRRVRKAREAKGWDHVRLGDRVSARVPQLHKIEAGQLRPSDDLARRLEKHLDIKLFEQVDAGPAAVGGATGKKPAGLTLGDLLKDAMKKE